MRAVKGLVAGMGILILIGMGLLVYGLLRTSDRLNDAPAVASRPAVAPVAAAALDPFDTLALGEPDGSRIAHMTTDGRGRLILGITGGGRPDRAVVVDPATGRRLGTITLAPDRYGLRSSGSQ